MKHERNPSTGRRRILAIILAIGGFSLSGCCCCESKQRLLEDFWPSTEERTHSLEQQRATEASDGYDYYEGATK
jgi:hypothetical protein